MNKKNKGGGKSYVVTIELLKTMLVTVVGAAVKVFCFSVSSLLPQFLIRSGNSRSD